jgi:NAD(P)-dependent dehydrogenase (short-subunit alcohol dehydrogenase family)
MKYAVVTGARQGLGRGFVEYLSSEGLTVFAGQHNSATDAHENNVITLPFDVTDDTSIESAYRTVASMTHTVDILINNAAVNKETVTDNHKEKVSTFGHLERDLLCRMFDINAVSPLMVTQRFLPLLTGVPSFVVNISSCRASFHDEETGEIANYGYCASKVALNMMTFSSVKDLPDNVKTFAVHPGNVRSKMNPSGESLPVEQAAKIISITENWRDEQNGRFLRTDGTFYPL